MDDLADACIFLMKNFDTNLVQDNGLSLVNIGTGEDITIKNIAELIKGVVGYKGEIVWDTTKPDGTPRKLLDVSKIKSMGWQPKMDIGEGIRKTYEWYESCQIE